MQAKNKYEISKEIQYWAGRLIGNEQNYEIAKEIVESIKNAEVLILETMHQEVFNEFHALRRQKGNARHIQVDGKEINEIIRLGKITTKKEHSLL